MTTIRTAAVPSTQLRDRVITERALTIEVADHEVAATFVWESDGQVSDDLIYSVTVSIVVSRLGRMHTWHNVTFRSDTPRTLAQFLELADTQSACIRPLLFGGAAKSRVIKEQESFLLSPFTANQRAALLSLVSQAPAHGAVRSDALVTHATHDERRNS